MIEIPKGLVVKELCDLLALEKNDHANTLWYDKMAVILSHGYDILVFLRRQKGMINPRFSSVRKKEEI